MRQIFTKQSPYAIFQILLVLAFLSGCANTVKKPEVLLKKDETTIPVLTKVHQAEYQKALDLMKSKSFDNAHVIFTNLTSIYPTLAGAYVNLAFIYKARADNNKAEEFINKALEINPNNVDALIQMAATSQTKGEFKDVERFLLAAEAVDHSNDIVQYNLAVLYELFLQQYDDAIDHYENYIALSSNEDKEIVKRWVKLLERK